jgi:hypothetical protein
MGEEDMHNNGINGTEISIDTLFHRKIQLETYSIAGISSTSLARTCNFDHLASPESIIAGNRICYLDAWQLGFLQATVIVHTGYGQM